MTEVFVSYSSQDRAKARQVAEALQAQGLSVWWDRQILPGQQFDKVIEEALEGAKCVVALWSTAAAESSWVRNEASEALRLNRLVPALIEADVRVPLEFRRVQAADLSGWLQTDHSTIAANQFSQFAGAVKQMVQLNSGKADGKTMRDAAPPPPELGKASSQPPAVQTAAPPVEASRPSTGTGTGNSSKWRWAAAGAAGVLLLGYFVAEQDIGEPLPSLAPQAAPTGALSGSPAPMAWEQSLRWRDYALNYEGRLRWSGNSATAALETTARDASNGAVVAQGNYTLGVVLDAPGRMVFSTQIQVPGGDTQTPGAHTHAVNLVFEQQNGGAWVFVKNCMAPGRPDLCYP